MIQDIFPHKFSNEFYTGTADNDDLLLVFCENRVLTKSDRFELPTCGEFPEMAMKYAFVLDQKRVWISESEEEFIEGWTFRPSSEYRSLEPQEIAYICTIGESLHRWYKNNQFCGRCGHIMRNSDKERALTCTVCHNTVYPRINPAVIVAITDEDRILLTKYARGNFKRYALVAGFCEIGETAEETVMREAWEEVGLHVKNIRFYKTQPWGVADDLLLGFVCEVDGNNTPALLDGELGLEEWFEREQIPDDFSNISLTGEMILKFKNGEL